jgi:hypothetical protein
MEKLHEWSTIKMSAAFFAIIHVNALGLPASIRSFNRNVEKYFGMSLFRTGLLLIHFSIFLTFQLTQSHVSDSETTFSLQGHGCCFDNDLNSHVSEIVVID